MGLVVLDAGVLIGFLNPDDHYHDQATQTLRRLIDGNQHLAIPSSVLAEILVAPCRHGDAAVAVVHDLVRRLPLEVLPLDSQCAQRAAQLRAAHGSLKLPDAIVIATSLRHHAVELVTTDRKWPTGVPWEATTLTVLHF